MATTEAGWAAGSLFGAVCMAAGRQHEPSLLALGLVVLLAANLFALVRH